MKKDKLYHKDIATVGDYVELNVNQDGTGFITAVEKRKNYLSRKAPKIKGASYRGERLEQIIASNIDNLFIISSIKLPLFNSRVVDRFLVTAESSSVKPSIVINKKDLDNEKLSKQWFNLYTSIGYEVFLTSTKTGEGIRKLLKKLPDKKNLFWGQSGVGKSSLLNYMFPGIDLKVGEISLSSEKGTHQTVTSIMIRVAENTFIIDTPGVREIDPFGIREEDLGHYFIEFADFITECRFSTCTHHHEPGCGVIKAVEEGKINELRYESYLRILETIEEDIIF